VLPWCLMALEIYFANFLLKGSLWVVKVGRSGGNSIWKPSGLSSFFFY